MAKKSAPPGHTVTPFPTVRTGVVDFMIMGKKKHNVHGFGEMDVTEPRKIIRNYKERTGTTLSFTGYIVYCLAKAVGENKHMHAIRKRGKVFLFDDVDIGMIVEEWIDGKQAPMPFRILSANTKTFSDIQTLIRNAQQGKHDAETIRRRAIAMKILKLPRWLRVIIYQWLRRNPHSIKKYFGTVGVTAVGMFATGSGWAIPISSPSLTVTLGTVVKKPGIIDNEIQIREYLNITFTVDHEVIDGSPAARFIAQLQDAISSARGLEDYR
jgi:pyruvate/2-oxoglutarate dehydrogenase complex dihydrolipoamide acyltransferase (E2) component